MQLKTFLKSKKTSLLLIGLNVILLVTLSLLTTLSATKAASSIADRVKGRILLQVEQNGEAWYINPVDLKRYYLGRPTNAFEIMRNLGLGATNNDLNTIEIGSINNYSPTIAVEKGYIKKAYIKDGKQYIDIDYIQWFSDEEAKEAALEDGVCTQIDYCAPNGFYIRNQNSQLRTFEVKEGISIKLVTQFAYSQDGIRYVDFRNQFIAFNSTNNLPYEVKIINNVITEISEIYIP